MFNANDLKYLANVEPVLSLYLSVNPAAPENRPSSPAWRTWLRNTLREMDTNLKDNVTWKEAHARADEFFTDYTPNGKGLVIFLGKDIQHSIDLPVAVENRAEFGAPVIAPLLWVLDEYQPYVVVRVDQEKAHLIVAHLGSIQMQEEMRHELHTEDWHERDMMSVVAGGAGQDQRAFGFRAKLEARIDAHIERFYQDVAAHTRELCGKFDASRVILGGNKKSAHTLQDLLKEVQILDIMSLTFNESADEVLVRALPVAEEFERKHEQTIVDEVINLARAGGRAVLGLEKVALALQEGRVELLVAAWNSEQDRGIERLIAQAWAAGSKIELVHGDAAKLLQSEQGVAARLYYVVKPV